MDTATEVDETLDSSTSTQEDTTVQPAEDSATAATESTDASPSVGEDEGQPAPVTATDGDQQPEASDSDKSPAQMAIDHLSGANKRARQKDAKEQRPSEGDPKSEQDKTTAAKPAKTDPKADKDGLTAEDRVLPARTQQRIQKLVSDRKAVETDLGKVRAEYEPIKATATKLGITDLAQVPQVIERGKAFDSVVERFKLADDVATIADEDAAGAIKFQASLARFAQGKGTQADLDLCRTVFDQLDKDREALGLKPAAPAAPQIDADAWDKALAKADTNLDFDDLRKLVDGLKAQKSAAPATAPKPAVAVQPIQPVNRQPAPAAVPVEDPNDTLYEQKAIRRITADGVKPAEVQAYFEKQLYPLVIKDLEMMYPGKNAIDVFKSIGSRERHDLTLEAHAAIQKQKVKAPADKPAPGQRPLASGGAKPAWAQPRPSASQSADAISFLAGE